TQAAPQRVVPPPQLMAHCPCEHTSPFAQVVPHAPQFSVLARTSTHSAPHEAVPVGHAVLLPPQATAHAASKPSTPIQLATVRMLSPRLHVKPRAYHGRRRTAEARLAAGD